MRRPWIALAALTAACGSPGATAEPPATPLPTPPQTIPGVGSLPDTVPTANADGNGGRSDEPLVVITRPVNADGVVADQIGEQVGGNRLLLIGDSIFAGTENRYGGEMCAGLEPLGWTVEVAAEAGRFVEFGVKVANRLIPEPDTDEAADGEGSAESTDRDDDWDAVGLFLGSNYNGDQENYDTKMREILDRIAPRPVLLYTVTEYRTNYSEVSAVIEDLVSDYDNVTVIDWARAAKTPGVLRADGLHPNDAGEEVLVDLTGAALGRAPVGEPDCLRSQFRDDSAINQGNGTPNTGGSSGGRSTSRGGSSSGSSSSGGSSSGSSSGGSSSGGSSSSSTGGTPTTQPGTTDGDTTDGGATDSGATDDGSTDGGTTDSGTTDGATTDGGSTDGGTTDGGTTDGGGTDGGTTDGGGTDGSLTDGGSTDGGGTDGGSTDGGTTDGGGSTDGSGSDSTTTGSTGGTTGGSTTSGSTTGGSTTSGSATTGGTTDGSATTGGATGGTSDGGTTDGSATTDS